MINKKCIVALGLLSFTLLLSFTPIHIIQLFKIPKWVGVTISAGILVVMLILLVVLHKHKIMYFIVIPINSIANGIAASSLFVYLDKFPEIWHTALLFCSLCLLFYIYCVCTRLSFFQNHYVICILIFIGIVITVCVIFLVVVGSAIFALALLSLLSFIASWILLIYPAKNFYDLIKTSAYLSFAVLGIVIVIVIFVISQGEALDGLDGVCDGVDVNKKQKNPYEYFTELQ